MISTLNKVISTPPNFIKMYILSFYGIDIAPFLLLILIHFVKYTIHYYAK